MNGEFNLKEEDMEKLEIGYLVCEVRLALKF